jgi:hypothetical protein
MREELLVEALSKNSWQGRFERENSNIGGTLVRPVPFT